MQYLQNDTAANIIADTVTSLVSKRLNQGKRLINVMSGGYDNNTHCYYFIDKDQSHIVNTMDEIHDKRNLYDVEVLMIHLEYIDIEDDDYSIYNSDVKLLEVRTLQTDSATASTLFLDKLYEDKDSKLIKKIYVYKNEVFNTEADLVFHLVDERDARGNNLLFNEL